MILVTGGAGYLGSHIVKRLVGRSDKVRVLVHNRDRAEEEGRLRGLNIDWVEGDITNPETLPQALDGVHTVIHTVAIAIEKGTKSYEEINYQGTINVVEASLKSDIKRFIHISQLGASPDIPYRFLASKGKAEKFVESSDTSWTIFKPSVIWGPEDEFANTFAKLVPFSPIIYPIVDKEAEFEPIWVEDVVTCVVKALDDPNTIGKKYEIGGPEVLTIEEIERRSLRAVGASRIFVPFPKPILKIIVSLMEALLPSPPVTQSLLELLAVNNVTAKNQIHQFVDEPRPFKPKYTSAYMKEFNFSDTLRQFFS